MAMEIYIRNSRLTLPYYRSFLHLNVSLFSRAVNNRELSAIGESTGEYLNSDGDFLRLIKLLLPSSEKGKIYYVNSELCTILSFLLPYLVKINLFTNYKLLKTLILQLACGHCTMEHHHIIEEFLKVLYLRFPVGECSLQKPFVE